MFYLSAAEWLLLNADPCQTPQPGGGIAPLRHDHALARYLEKQAAQRMSATHSPDVWGAVSGHCKWMAQCGFAALRHLRLSS